MQIRSDSKGGSNGACCKILHSPIHTLSFPTSTCSHPFFHSSAEQTNHAVGTVVSTGEMKRAHRCSYSFLPLDGSLSLSLFSSQAHTTHTHTHTPGWHPAPSVHPHLQRLTPTPQGNSHRHLSHTPGLTHPPTGWRPAPSVHPHPEGFTHTYTHAQRHNTGGSLRNYCAPTPTERLTHTYPNTQHRQLLAHLLRTRTHRGSSTEGCPA
eukprot:scaffold167774_cov19-Tisochrysis_lutea.AAC.2